MNKYDEMTDWADSVRSNIRTVAWLLLLIELQIFLLIIAVVLTAAWMAIQ
jgi:hypothetical protein